MRRRTTAPTPSVSFFPSIALSGSSCTSEITRFGSNRLDPKWVISKLDPKWVISSWQNGSEIGDLKSGSEIGDLRGRLDPKPVISSPRLDLKSVISGPQIWKRWVFFIRCPQNQTSFFSPDPRTSELAASSMLLSGARAIFWCKKGPPTPCLRRDSASDFDQLQKYCVKLDDTACLQRQ